MEKERDVQQLITRLYANVKQTRANKKKIGKYKPSIHKLVSVAVGFDIGKI